MGMAGVGFAITLYLGIGWLLDLWWLSERPLLLIGVVLMIIGVQFVLFGLLAEMVTQRSGDRDEMPIARRIGTPPDSVEPTNPGGDGH